MNMDKISAFFVPLEKNKVFNFTLRGDLNTCTECMNVLKVLDPDEHGIQFLYVQHEGTPNSNGTRNIHGLLEMKEYATIADVLTFFDRFEFPLRDHISRVAECKNVHCWVDFKKKNRFDSVVLEKGSLTVPPYSPLFNEG